MVTEKQTKTGRARRIALDLRTVEALDEHRAGQERRAEAYGDSLAPTSFVCSHATDGSKPLRPDRVSSLFRQLTRRLEVNHVRLHHLRHFAAAHLLTAGVPVETVSGRLGHSNPAMTLNVYSQFQQASDQHAANVLGDILR